MFLKFSILPSKIWNLILFMCLDIESLFIILYIICFMITRGLQFHDKNLDNQ